MRDDRGYLRWLNGGGEGYGSRLSHELGSEREARRMILRNIHDDGKDPFRFAYYSHSFDQRRNCDRLIMQLEQRAPSFIEWAGMVV